MRILKQLALVLGTGYIFVYFSEHLFWARVRPDDSLVSWLGAWIAYSLAAFIFLHLITFFRVTEKWSLFLAGAVFGWLAEGVIVQTTYEMLPLSISFTGLAWHALITVWIGWYAVRRALISPASFSTVSLFTAIGFFYSLWAINWWLEPDGGVATLAEFSIYILTITCLAALAYALANWGSSESFAPNRWVTRLVYAAFCIYFAFVTVPAAPISLLILPLLLGLAYYGLRRHPAEERACLASTLHGRISPRNYLALFALPLTAIAFYALALALNLQWHTNWILYFITTPLGFILFGIGVFKKSVSTHP
ncbi:MAG: hypothetical protein HFACDABA_00811 [Anaerolineales bacterium]|nr:hypothetical protein [Anaerolineales bacterium]